MHAQNKQLCDSAAASMEMENAFRQPADGTSHPHQAIVSSVSEQHLNNLQARGKNAHVHKGQSICTVIDLLVKDCTVNKQQTDNRTTTTTTTTLPVRPGQLMQLPPGRHAGSSSNTTSTGLKPTRADSPMAVCKSISLLH
jgi:hypothetical protein